MVWETEEIKEIIRHLGPVSTLWLLAIIEKRVGTNKAHHYKVFPGKIKSLSKKYDMDEPEQDEISSAFGTLRRADIPGPEGGTDNIIVGDKEEYVKLTTLGITLVTRIDNSPEIQEFIRTFLGDESDEVEDWFPADNPPEAPIKLSTTSPPPEGEPPFDVETRAEFDCPYRDCNGTIVHTYTFEHPEETWVSRVQTECPECGETWEHVVGNAYNEPSKLDA